VKLLLDTHILLWSVFEPERLSRRVARALIDPENELWFSAVSVWELVLLDSKKRIELGTDVATWVRQTLEQLNINEVPVTFEVALATKTAGLAHNDPADRFLAASAKVFALTLVTADERLISAPDISIFPNRQRV
jgi:PIN domain nuclease of toxin-antitoxin system